MTFDLRRFVRPHLADYQPYVSTSAASARWRSSLPAEAIVKLDANENAYGPSPRVLEALARERWYHRYPDHEQAAVREALAEYAGLSPVHVVLGNGSDELIGLLAQAFVGPGDAVVLCRPTFPMYATATTLVGGTVVSVPLTESFDLDLPRLREAVDARTKLLFITNPNSPAGNAVPLAQIEALAALDCLLVVDEAYVEFGGETAAPWVRRFPNLAVLRTFSKWAGLAGLRVGYALAPEPIAGLLNSLRAPYNVSVAGLVAALASLEDRAHLMANVRAIVAERERLSRLLREQGVLEPLPSQGNFLLCRVRRGEAADLHRRLAERGILLRHFADEPRLQDMLRVTVGKPEHTDQLIAALSVAATGD